MAWQRTENILHRRLNQHGLTGQVQAGQICLQAEHLYPGLFRAVSVRQACLHLELERGQAILFKMIEGKLLQELAEFAKHKNLPEIERVRLTFTE